MCNKFVGADLFLQLLSMTLPANLQSLQLCLHLRHLVPHMCLSLRSQLPSHSRMHACVLKRAACKMWTLLALSLMHQNCGVFQQCWDVLMQRLRIMLFGKQVLTRTANIWEPSDGPNLPRFLLQTLCVNNSNWQAREPALGFNAEAAMQLLACRGL